MRWPLLDVVLVPDSAGLWLLAAPTPATTQWESGSHLVEMDIDAVLALQWVTVARKFLSVAPGEPAHFTPPLPEQDGPAIIVLGTNPDKKRSPKTAFVLLVSDSALGIRWKSFASSAEVDTLLAALEAAATAGWAGTYAAGWNTPADREPDTPVNVVSQPRPGYPNKLATRGRVGRVWLSFVVSAAGRADPGSFFTLLSDDSLFTQSAIQALIQGRYRPATLNGEPVDQRVFQVVLFRQETGRR